MSRPIRVGVGSGEASSPGEASDPAEASPTGEGSDLGKASGPGEGSDLGEASPPGEVSVDRDGCVGVECGSGWTNPTEEDFAGVTIRRAESAPAPESVTDGRVGG